MKTFLDKNLMLLKDDYPHIYELVCNKSYDTKRIKVTETRNSMINIAVTDSNGNEQLLYSRYDPVMESDKWLQSIEDQMADVQSVLFCGLGLGYHMQAFLNHYTDKKIYLYEPDLDVFLAAIKHVDLTNILNNKQIAALAVGSDSVIQSELLGLVYNTMTGNFNYIIVPAYRKHFPETIDNLLNSISTTSLSYLSSLQTIRKFQVEWSENLILNLDRVINSYSAKYLKGMGKDVPAIVVGSGPSLGMEIEWLRKLKNHALIIAAGSSIQALMRHGVEPDLAVSIDPSDINLKVYEKLDTSRIPLLFVPTIKHTILDQSWSHLLHAFFHNDAINHYFMDLNLDDDPVFFSTATVTGTAIQVALYLQCPEIVLIGQDFSYPGDKFYAEGVTHVSQEDLDKSVEKATKFIENVNGGQNKTNSNMIVLKHSVEFILETFPNVKYYNASRIGAVIKFTESKTLEQLYMERKQHQFANGWFLSLLDEKLAYYDQARVQGVLEKIKEAIKTIPELSEKISQLEEHLRSSTDYTEHDHEEILEWLYKFHHQWNDISGQKIFKEIYTFLLSRECNYLARHRNEINNEPNLYLRMFMIIKCIAPILTGYHKVTPVLQNSLDLLETKLNERGIACRE